MDSHEKVHGVHSSSYWKRLFTKLVPENSLQLYPLSQSVVTCSVIRERLKNTARLKRSNQYGYRLHLVTSVFALDVDEPDSLSCLKAFFKKKAIASCAPRLDRPRDRQTMLPTSRSPLAIIWRDDFFPGSLHGEVLAVGVEGTTDAAVFWAERLASAASKSWGNWYAKRLRFVRSWTSRSR